MRAVHPIRGLVASQFLGSFNDNAFKLLIVVLARRAVEADPTLDSAAQERELYAATALTFSLFTLPHLLFFVPAGWLADRFSKRRVLVLAKVAEVGLLLAAAAWLWRAPTALGVPLGLLTLLGVRNGLLSPSKYGLVPELVPLDRLTRSNGVLELFTFLAIIGGAAAGPVLAHEAGAHPARAALVLAALAVLGLGAAWAIPRAAAPPPRAGVWASAAVAWRAVRERPALRFAMGGAFAFWVVASLLGQDFVVYAQSVLGVPEAEQGLLLGVLGLGAGAGALLVGRVTRRAIPVRWVPGGGLALGALTLLAGLLVPGYGVTLAFLALLGVAGGFVIVPIDSLLQWHAPPHERGAVIAFANLFVFGGMLVGFVLGGVLSRAGLDAAGILVVAALPTLGVSALAVGAARRL